MGEVEGGDNSRPRRGERVKCGGGSEREDERSEGLGRGRGWEGGVEWEGEGGGEGGKLMQVEGVAGEREEAGGRRGGRLMGRC